MADGRTNTEIAGRLVLSDRTVRNHITNLFAKPGVTDRLQEQGALVWLNLCQPHHDQLHRPAVELVLEPHAVDDAIASGERPKATRHATHTS